MGKWIVKIRDEVSPLEEKKRKAQRKHEKGRARRDFKRELKEYKNSFNPIRGL